MEDIDQFHNLPLINTLRDNARAAAKKGGAKGNSKTIDQDDAGSKKGDDTAP